MSIYVIGDVQGCYDELMQLVERLRFDPADDQLWFVGDLVNRGPASLDVLRFVHSLGDSAATVLGNHDLHLLAVAYGERQSQPGDTLEAVLRAPDRGPLIDWLRRRPLLFEDRARRIVVAHAGLPPIWTVEHARSLAVEVERVIASDDVDEVKAFLHGMYGNEPSVWREELQGMARLRTITNYLTRMRAIDHNGGLLLQFSDPAEKVPAPYRPWFDYYREHPATYSIAFGHWASLQGKTNVPRIFALDTGCVWGGALTALNLDDHTRISVPAADRRSWRSKR